MSTPTLRKPSKPSKPSKPRPKNRIEKLKEYAEEHGLRVEIEEADNKWDLIYKIYMGERELYKTNLSTSAFAFIKGFHAGSPEIWEL